MSDTERSDTAGDGSASTEYGLTLLLDRLESLVEEMDEIGVTTRSAAESHPLVGEEMDELGVASRAEAVARISDLHRRLDSEF